MTLMKQARAFGVGVVLATQNPVDIDYKAISNAGTWMVGRLQTERDKDRLLDGMSAADGGVDIGAVSDTISGLDKREFVLRRAGKDEPEVFTTRWAMSYLRGPMTKDQIKQVSGERACRRCGSARDADERLRPRRRLTHRTRHGVRKRSRSPRQVRGRGWGPVRGGEAASGWHAGDARRGGRRRRALGRRGGAVARRRRRRRRRHDVRAGHRRQGPDALRRVEGRPRPRRGLQRRPVPARRPSRRQPCRHGRRSRTRRCSTAAPSGVDVPAHEGADRRAPHLEAGRARPHRPPRARRIDRPPRQQDVEAVLDPR